MTESLPLVHVVRRPQQPSDAPPLLVLLHGYGSNERDLFGLVPYLDKRFATVALRAPHPVMAGSYGWFNLEFVQDGLRYDPVQAEASRKTLVETIKAAVAAYGANPHQVFLLGFSQGAMMSAAVLLSEPELLAGVVLMSGAVWVDALEHRAPAEQLVDKPVLMVHGLYDQTLPIEVGRAGRDTLEATPVDLEYHEFPMAHEVSAASLDTVAHWLSARIN